MENEMEIRCQCKLEMKMERKRKMEDNKECQRKQPCKPVQLNWEPILGKNLTIPMNQREYAWGKDEIIRFLNDMINTYEGFEHNEFMGSIINYQHSNGNDIYDGQQRILTTTLILHTIGSLSSKVKSKTDPLLSVDTDIDDLTQQQQEMKDKMKVSIIPKIFCVNPYDMKALVNIINDKIKSWVTHISNIESIETFDDDKYVNKYKCKHCDHCVSRKSDFIRHIEKSHDYSKPPSDSKLYDAYIEIYDFFVIKEYDEQELICIYKFIRDNIDIQFYNCDDPVYVSQMFDWLNNRGKAVEPLDIVKNQIMAKIPYEKRLEVYDKWEKIKRTDNKIYKNFGPKTFDVAIQLYNNDIKRTFKHDNLFSPIINSEDTYREINIFFTIVEKICSIMDKISNDRFGRLINNKSSICINWEGYMWCLIPTFYTIDKIDKKLIKLFVKWYFRNLQFGNRNFNNLAYSNEFIKITNSLLNDNKFDYYIEIEKCLQENKDTSINNENYSREMKDMIFKSSVNATYLLLFLETCLNTDLHIVPLEYTLEHIWCQKDKKILITTHINNIGNLTLLEGKNSENGHKGNSSLGAKLYSNKKNEYKKSSSMITRNVAEKYDDTFEEKNIVERSEQIVQLLNQYTDY